MAQTTAGQILISFIIFTALITGMFTMISGAIPDNAGNFSDYNRTFNKFAEIESNTDTIANKMETDRPTSGVEGIVTGLWETSFGAIQVMWTSITTVTTLIGELSTGGLPLPIPTWFTGMLISIILAAISFAIIASIRKWQV